MTTQTEAHPVKYDVLILDEPPSTIDAQTVLPSTLCDEGPEEKRMRLDDKPSATDGNETETSGMENINRKDNNNTRSKVKYDRYTNTWVPCDRNAETNGSVDGVVMIDDEVEDGKDKGLSNLHDVAGDELDKIQIMYRILVNQR